jgi:hypothetical protein
MKGVVDPLIEEEWTFYQAPRTESMGVQEVQLPDPEAFFNVPQCRGALCVAHFAAADEAEKKALLEHFAKDSSATAVQDAASRIILAAGGSSAEASPPQEQGSLAYAALLENRDRPLELVLVAEASASASTTTAAAADLQAAVGACLGACPGTGLRRGRALAFGPPLWAGEAGTDLDKPDKETYPF